MHLPSANPPTNASPPPCRAVYYTHDTYSYTITLPDYTITLPDNKVTAFSMSAQPDVIGSFDISATAASADQSAVLVQKVDGNAGGKL